MDTEIEAKWLRINAAAFREKLTAAGATQVYPERMMVRRVYDFPDKRLAQIGGWVRVRDEAGKITMSYKQLTDRSVTGTQEVTLTVDDFEAAHAFLLEIGLEPKSIQETKRESWTLDGAEIEIDTWPWIPAFVEIEAKSEALLRATAEKLGLSMNQALHGSVETAYQDIYDVTEADVDSWSEIRFSDVPEPLLLKKKP